MTDFTPVSLATSSSSSLHFQDVSDLFPDSDSMAKKGGRLGKLIAKYRTRAIYAALILMALGTLPILIALGNGVALSMRTVAAGINYLRDPASVTLANKVEVRGVHQPTMAIQTYSQASMVVSDIRALRQDRRLLTPELITQGYLEWRVASGEPMHNFTLDATSQMVTKTVKMEDCSCSCVCYLYIGVAENIVFMRSTNEVLYEPSIVSETVQKGNVSAPSQCGGKAPQLVRDALSLQERKMVEETQKQTSATAGFVHYITSRGALKQRNFKHPEFNCIKECIAFFQ